MNDYLTGSEDDTIPDWVVKRHREREQRRLQRWLAVYCGACGVVLMLAVGGGCSVALGVALVVVGGVLWSGARVDDGRA